MFQLRTPRMIAPSSPPEISVEMSSPRSEESGKLAPPGRIQAAAAHEETEQTEAHTRDQRKAKICDQRTAEAQHVGALPREAPLLPPVVNHPSPFAAPSFRWVRLLQQTVLHGGDACARARYSGWHFHRPGDPATMFAPCMKCTHPQPLSDDSATPFCLKQIRTPLNGSKLSRHARSPAGSEFLLTMGHNPKKNSLLFNFDQNPRWEYPMTTWA